MGRASVCVASRRESGDVHIFVKQEPLDRSVLRVRHLVSMWTEGLIR